VLLFAHILELASELGVVGGHAGHLCSLGPGGACFYHCMRPCLPASAEPAAGRR
jgi:hypothetical protein